MLSKMAAGKVLCVSQNYFLNFFGKCWNFQQRNISKQRIVLGLVGNVHKPKKPLSAFLKFAMDRKSEVSAQYPEKRVKDIMKILGTHWSKLPMNEKEKYFNMYQEEKKAYFDKIKSYEESLAKIGKDKLIQAISDFKNSEIPKAGYIIKSMLRKSLNKPKAPCAPYIRFVSHLKERGETFSLKELAQMWNTLPEKEKCKYKADYGKEWIQYEKELESWERKMIKEGHLDVVRLKTLRNEVNKTP